jgi:hypothetical protein
MVVLAAVRNCWGGSEHSGLNETTVGPWLEQQWKTKVGAENDRRQLVKDMELAKDIIANMAATIFTNQG